MSRAAVVVLALLLAGCGIDGAPLAPEGAVAPVAAAGIGVTEPDGGA